MNSKLIEKATCHIKCGNSLGTGFLINKDTILTANHVLVQWHTQKKEIDITFRNCNSELLYKGTIIGFDEELDTAIVQLDSNNLEIDTLKLLASPILPSETWSAYGFPNTEHGQLAGSLEKGEIWKSITRHDLTKYDVELNCVPYSPKFKYEGLSGSAVILENGHVFGLLLKKLNRSLGAITIQKLESFLLKNRIVIEKDWEKYEDKPFSQNWFYKHLTKIIDSAGPRYTSKANVELKEIKNLFEALGRTKEFYTYFFKLYGDAKKALNAIKLNDSNTQHLQSKIEDYLNPLFAKMISINQKNNSFICWEDIGLIAANCQEKIEEVEREVKELNKPKNGQASSGKYDYELSKIRNLLECLYDIEKVSKSNYAFLSNLPSLLLKGKAGQGKTHLLCDVASQRIEQGLPTLMFFGHHFNLNDPFQQILAQLDLNISKTDFLRKLNQLGEAKGCRSLIFIDALNEGVGKELWQNHIRNLLHEIQQYPYIGIVVSIRTPFEEIIIPTDLIKDKKIFPINHYGFKGNEFEAIKIYFQAYKIQLHSIPFLSEEFSNPLFLKIFCEGLVAKKQYRLPKGWQKFTSVFHNYLETRNIIISGKIDLDPKRKIVEKALRCFAEYMMKTDIAYIDRDKAHEICEQLVPRTTWHNSLLYQLISEGLLLESLRYNKSAMIDTIEFGYERFGDYMKAEYLIQNYNLEDPAVYKEPNSILSVIFDNKNDYPHYHRMIHYSNIIDALWILIAEKYNKELFEILPEYYEKNVFIDAFLNSLVWRSYESINADKSLTYIESLLNSGHEIHNRFLSKILLVASDPYHPFNGDYLHDWLMSHESISERDFDWSIKIHNSYKNDSIIDSYIKWAWVRDDKSHISDESMLLSCTVLSWFLTTSNRFLRDDTTKALICLLKNRIPVLIKLLSKFNDVNDIYVLERLYAVAYGCTMFSNKASEIQSIAQYTYYTIFKDGNPPVHVLLRDYARNCVERALFLNLPITIEVDKIRPPYNSEWIEAISEEEAEKYDIERKQAEKWSNEDLGQARLYSSVMGFEDFARYIIGTNSGMSGWSIMNIKNKGKYNTFKKNLKGKAKKNFKLYEDCLNHKTIFDNAKPHKIKNMGEEIWKSICLSINQNIKQIEPMLMDSFNETEKVFFVEHVLPYLATLFEHKDIYGKKQFDLSILQRLIIKKVFDLGWTKEMFGEFDSQVNRHYAGRTANKEERIGKKYQWIAYHEFIARLADNFEFMKQFGDKKAGIYLGPWCDSSLRDIDPTILINKKENTPSNQFEGIFDDFYEIDLDSTFEDWVANKEDLPEITDYLKIIDNFGEEWLQLEQHRQWNDPDPIDVDKFSISRKQIWYQTRSYLVKKTKKKSFYEWAIQQDFMGRWMPESRDRYEYFLRESYWSPAYWHYQTPYYEKDFWTNPSKHREHAINTKVLVTTEEHLKESGGYDCSVEDSIHTYLPCSFISQEMKLHFGDLEGYLYDEKDNLIAFDPSMFEGGKSGLLINVEKFRAFLDANDLDIVWTLLGEKLVLGRHLDNNYKRMEISGAFCFNEKGKIIGKTNYR